MSFAIIVDSCCDLSAAEFRDGPYLRVPLTISVGGEEMVDDDAFDQTRLLMLAREDPEAPKTACPSPAAYLAAFETSGADDLYVVTLSALLSGSHNAAAQARSIWLEEHPEARVYVFNSCSAAAGEVLVAQRIRACAEEGRDFQAVVSEVSRFISSMTTYFVLENLDHLRKNGRLTGPVAVAAMALRVKLLCAGTPEGEIKRVGQALSIRQALSRMVALMAEDPGHTGKTLSIVHVNCPDRAFFVRDLARESCSFKSILINEARGVSTVYASDGGIVVAF